MFYGSPQSPRAAEAWVDNLNRETHVGSRHHIVPRFYLQRFANKAGQLSVLRRDVAEPKLRNVADIGIKDFNTFIAKDGVIDGRMETVLGLVETEAAAAIKHATSPFSRERMTQDVRATLAMFTGFQMVRGQRTRRRIELSADIYAKSVTTDESLKSAGMRRKDLKRIVAVPHPNEHISMLGKLAEPIATRLLHRPASIIEIDHPAFITCDEPVLLSGGHEAADQHLPSCQSRRNRKPTKRSPKAARVNTLKDGDTPLREIIHIKSTYTVGIDNADEVVLPLDPRRILVFWPVGQRVDSYMYLAGEDARALAQECRQLALENAYIEVYGHPVHTHLKDAQLPPLKPLMTICGLTDVERSVAGSLPDPIRSQMLRDWRNG